ncbi:hypothetical protein [Paraburkholderia caledonica]|jgi:hypothetical protein|uniref:hypothetical protein n=1 Tax=Paraburkholderia caledonica TaxID=134536 RepID=UPI00048391DE|nr:hypothetical protein [Paraburkholderia caledonica]
MEAKRKTCVITLFDEDAKTISYHHVPQDLVAAAIEKSTSVDVPLEDFDNRLDDDFARRLGGMILLILAGRSPFLKSHLALTTESDHDASGSSSGPGTTPPETGKRSWWGKKP